jgi:serine phosphatase RsbU (regulator of sigma subunit)
VADVMGHGIPAALVASMVKLAFSLQTEHARDPAMVLTSMNRILCRHLERSYVTAVYAVVDTEVCQVTLANAGHPPPLFQRRGETVPRAEDEHGLILGFFPRRALHEPARRAICGWRPLATARGSVTTIGSRENAREAPRTAPSRT